MDASTGGAMRYNFQVKKVPVPEFRQQTTVEKHIINQKALLTWISNSGLSHAKVLELWKIIQKEYKTENPVDVSVEVFELKTTVEIMKQVLDELLASNKMLFAQITEQNINYRKVIEHMHEKDIQQMDGTDMEQVEIIHPQLNDVDEPRRKKARPNSNTDSNCISIVKLLPIQEFIKEEVQSDVETDHADYDDELLNILDGNGIDNVLRKESTESVIANDTHTSMRMRRSNSQRKSSPHKTTTADNRLDNDVRTMFPLDSFQSMDYMEERLSDQDFRENLEHVTTHLTIEPLRNEADADDILNSQFNEPTTISSVVKKTSQKPQAVVTHSSKATKEQVSLNGIKFPIETISMLDALENMTDDPDVALKLSNLFAANLPTKLAMYKKLRLLVADEVLAKYVWVGGPLQISLSKYKLFSVLLKDAWSSPNFNFDDEMMLSIQKANERQRKIRSQRVKMERKRNLQDLDEQYIYEMKKKFSKRDEALM